MKYRFFLSVLISIFSCSFLQAKKIDIRKAEIVAGNWAQSENRLKSSKAVNVELVFTERGATARTSVSEDVVYYYVFNVNDNNGYVIVAGDDVIVPIIGYSSYGRFEADDLPENMKYWLNELQKEIEYVSELNIDQNDEIKAKWDSYLSGELNSLRLSRPALPLLQTKWGQTGVYSLLCPLFETDGGYYRTATGCVATAMAQIMKHYEWPNEGVGQSIPYTTPSLNLMVPSVDFSVEYKWELMSDTYPNIGAKDPENAMSTLMYHCAVSVGTDFRTIFEGGSGAENLSPAKAWTTFFDYDRSIQSKYRTYYTNSRWDAMLMYEIDAGRPVYYSGTDDDGLGHAFICDGYDGSGLFHFNWGWGGLHDDAYFVSSVLNPGVGGTGAGTGEYNYNHAILINVIPNANGMETYEIKLMPGTNPESSTRSAAKGEIFTVSARFINAGVTTFAGRYGVALTDENGSILEIIGTYDDEELAPGYSFDEPFSILCAVSENIDEGRYKIQAAVKPLLGEWMIVEGDVNAIDRLDLYVRDEIIPDKSDPIMYNDPNEQGLTINSDLQKGRSASVTVSLLNRGDHFVGELDLGLYSLNGELMQLIERKNLSVETGQAVKIDFMTSEVLISGEYKLALYGKAATGTRKMIPSFEEFLNNIMVTVEPENISSLHEAKGPFFLLYPNPVEDMLHISSKEELLQSVHIVDLSGRLLKTVSNGPNETQMNIPVDDLNAGIYLVNIRTINGLYTEKMMKK